jgi:outer membrane receptor protein involved in Fe transport
VDGLLFNSAASYSMNRVKTAAETLNHTMSPAWLVNQGISYSFRRFELGADMRYRSRMYFDLANMYELDSSLRFDARVNYTYKNLTLGLHVDNIFDERSFSNGMTGAAGPLYFIDAPRSFHVDARWIF